MGFVQVVNWVPIFLAVRTLSAIEVYPFVFY